MAIVSSSLFKNTALGSTVYSDRGARRIDQFHREAERPSGHTEEFFLERRVFLLCCQCEALAANGPPVDCRPGRGPRGAGPLRDPGCRTRARSQSWLVHTWVSIPAFQQAHTSSAAPAASDRRGALLSQGIWVCKLQKDLLHSLSLWNES